VTFSIRIQTFKKCGKGTAIREVWMKKDVIHFGNDEFKGYSFIGLAEWFRDGRRFQ
jgi:hypothetical protein